mgnify:CR=1 FL=1
MKEDASIGECTEGQRASMIEVNRMYKLMNDNAAKGSSNFTNTDAIEDFAQTFTKLGTKSFDIVRGSVSYLDLNNFINAAFTDEQIIQW